MSELLFWQGLPWDRFEGDIWPPTEVISIRMASGTTISDGGGGGAQWRLPRSMPENISRRRRAPRLHHIESCSVYLGECSRWCICVKKSLQYSRWTRGKKQLQHPPVKTHSG